MTGPSVPRPLANAVGGCPLGGVPEGRGEASPNRRRIFLPKLERNPVPGTCGHPAARLRPAWAGDLYRPAGSTPTAPKRTVELRAVPYYAWANREPGGMAVRLRSGPGEGVLE
jgi:hypothetical protein